MNTLRLNIINLHAPYRVWQKSGKPDHYYFVSDSRPYHYSLTLFNSKHRCPSIKQEKTFWNIFQNVMFIAL